MIKKVEHIGIAVEDEPRAVKLFNTLLGQKPYKEEAVKDQGVNTTFYIEDHTKLELLSATSEESPIQKFIEKRGAGIHHIAFAVDDIYQEIQRLKAAGFQFIHEEPKAGADNKLIVFIHPKSAGGVLVELCQDLEDGKS